MSHENISQNFNEKLNIIYASSRNMSPKFKTVVVFLIEYGNNRVERLTN